jgi:hypothetical protein
VGLRLDKDDLSGRCTTERVPLWSTGGPEVVELPPRKNHPKPIKKGVVSVFSELIVCAWRPPLHGTDTEGLIQHIGMLIHEVLDPAKAALRALRLRESTHWLLRRSETAGLSYSASDSSVTAITTQF